MEIRKTDLAGNVTKEEALVLHLGRGVETDQNADGTAEVRLGEEVKTVATVDTGTDAIKDQATPDFRETFINTIVLDGPTIAIQNPLGVAAGSTYILILKQDATGGRAATWGTAYKWPGGGAPALTGAASAVDVITFVAESDTIIYGAPGYDFR